MTGDLAEIDHKSADKNTRLKSMIRQKAIIFIGLTRSYHHRYSQINRGKCLP